MSNTVNPHTTACFQGEALAMYRRLCQRGQTNVLARLSVEARFSGQLNSEQRQTLHRLLCDFDHPVPGTADTTGAYVA